MDEYKDLKDLLKPRRDIKASDSFRRKIKGETDIRTGHIISRRWFWGGALSLGATVAAVLILIFVPAGMSAKQVLAETISALKKAGNIEMKVKIRTESREIFSQINPDAEFTTHDIKLQRADSAQYWYISKGERTAEKNSNGLYMWLEKFNIGWHYSQQQPNVLGYLNVLMQPEDIFESELQYTLSNPASNHKITKKNGEILLTIHSPRKGDFSNPYALNTSIDESENIRRYVIDERDFHLKSASVSIVVDSREIEVLKVTDIDYNPKEFNLPSIPDHICFIEDDNQQRAGIPGLDPRETAYVFLNALSTWDTGILHKFLSDEEAEEIYRSTYEGASLLSLGQPFKSGSNQYMVFVPYILRLNDGYIKKMNIALVKYPESNWVFDGGL